MSKIRDRILRGEGAHGTVTELGIGLWNPFAI